MNEVEFYLEDLKSKFSKINPSEYYLAYSGGRDSHFLLWFIMEYLHEDRIMPVFSNTGMEIPEIRDRALANAQVVLKPVLKHAEIKEKYGIPLNTKASDEWVYRYQERRERGVSDEDMPRWIKYYAMRQVDAIEHGRKRTAEIHFGLFRGKLCIQRIQLSAEVVLVSTTLRRAYGSSVLTQIGKRKEYISLPIYTERDAEAVFRGRSSQLQLKTIDTAEMPTGTRKERRLTLHTPYTNRNPWVFRRGFF